MLVIVNIKLLIGEKFIEENIDKYFSKIENEIMLGCNVNDNV